MRVLVVFGIVASVGACRAEVVRPSALPSAPLVRKPTTRTLPRYFPRAPASLAWVGQTDEGTAAMLGPLRVLLRDDDGLPDASPWQVSSGTSDSAGTPTGANAGNALEVPARLGGGWLFVVGRGLWHAPSWLAKPVRLFELGAPPRVYLGLDAPIAQEPGRAAFAFRVTDGRSIPLTRWPVSPAVADFAARDDQHAAVVADLRGLSLTEDGGNSWRTIASNRTPLGVRAVPGGYLVRGRNGSDERELTWRIDPHGDPQGEPSSQAEQGPPRRPMPSAAWERVVEHGYDDATHDRYVVLDHGVLERYRKSDGALLGRSNVGDPADTCRPIHRPGSTGETELACSSPTRTSIWRVGSDDAAKVLELPGARRIWSSESGTLALEGACEPTAPRTDVTTLCVWGSGTPRTVRLQGASRYDLLVPLADGSLVVLRPPSGPRQSRRPAEMFVDRSPKANGAMPVDRAPKANGAMPGARVQGVVLRPGAAWKSDIVNHVAQGHWLGDLEALPDGGFAGWIEHEGRILGYRVSTEGTIEVGPRSGVATTHRMAGLRSLSWTAGGAASESVDGGMHYTQTNLPPIEVPDDSSRTSRAREKPQPTGSLGCTAVGCILPNLLRVGWGVETGQANARPPSWPVTSLSSARLALDCAVVARRTDVALPPRMPAARPSARLSSSWSPFRSSAGGLQTPFFGSSLPKVRADQALQSWDSQDLADRRTATLTGRMLSWGTFAIGTDPDEGWQWRWYDPATTSVHSTAIARPPAELSFSQRLQSGGSRGTWSVSTASEPRHALGFQTDGSRTLAFSLIDGEAPTRIELGDGTELGTIESALAAPGDRALFAGPVGDPAGTAVYLARGSRAERIAWVPRLGTQGRPSPALVASHSDGVRVAVAVEDHDVPSRSDAAFFVREVYPDEGPIRRYTIESRAEHQPRVLQVCDPAGTGFEAWTKLDLAGELRLTGSTRVAQPRMPMRAKLRFQDDGGLCLLELTTAVDAEGQSALASLPVRAGSTAGSIPVLVSQDGRHHTLACTAK